MTNSGESFGQRLKRERLKRDLTQRQLADKVAVGVPHISKLEAGRESPSDDLIVKLARVFGVDADELRIAARKPSEKMIEMMASDPEKALAFFRTIGKPKR